MVKYSAAALGRFTKPLKMMTFIENSGRANPTFALCQKRAAALPPGALPIHA
jgi:hypothetical protein